MTTKEKTIVIGARGSQLSVRQTRLALDMLQAAHPHHRFQLTTIASSGDNHPDTPIERLGVGAFVKELQFALLRREIDVAVHSLKDLPTAQTPGLVLAAIPIREDPRDALVDRWGLPLERLPAGARIGTGSPRRMAQVRHMRPDLQVLPIRGNVTTRLDKAHGADYDGAVLALAGLRRLGLDGDVSQVFAPDVLVPAPGQGALALEVREDDAETLALVRSIQHYETFIATRAERAFLAALGGGCRAPYGAHAVIAGNTVTLTGMVGEHSGQRLYKATASGSVADPEAVAMAVYEALQRQGAGPLIQRMKEL
ncbi:MAG: hydroxymethylbilane synthase [Chloroflexi bacterium]|nr:hydroxymethylbilane synthase [Chloroflexota bacterium]